MILNNFGFGFLCGLFYMGISIIVSLLLNKYLPKKFK